MPEDPLLTRETLLIRLKDTADDASWAEFAEIYTPLLFGFCRKRGLSEADTSDIIQEVMRSLARAMGGFEYDRSKGKFKGWLFTVLRNAIASHFRKAARRPLTPGETQVINTIDQDPSTSEQLDWDRDYQRQLLAWAMHELKPNYADHIWQAFEETALRDRDPNEVATELGMTTNAVGVAKHRITKRLREKAESVDAEQWEEDMIARANRASE